MSSPLVVTVTGGIGTGKSKVCEIFAEYGVPVIDADIAAREVVEPGTTGLRRVVDAFGPDVLTIDGRLDRSCLRGIVFANEAARVRLESILHPLIRDRINEQLTLVTAPYCLLCIPLLAEHHGYHMTDRILVVDCPPETQISRVMQRDDLTADEVRAIMDSQSGREQRLELADDVISNAASVDLLRAQVARLHQQYLAIASTTAAKEH